MSARTFLEGLEGAPRPERERQVLAARELWIDWPRVRVPVVGGRIVLEVTADVFALGSADEPIRVPLSGPGAQAVADALGMRLITPAISDAIWRAADVKIQPILGGSPGFPVRYDASMLSVAQLLAHNDRVEAERAGRTGLVAGHKKDVVLSNVLEQHADRVCIYGEHARATIALTATRTVHPGEPVQPLYPCASTPAGEGHEASYADFSHGIRFVAVDVELDGELVTLDQALDHPELGPELSAPGEGRLRVRRYPCA